MRQDTAGMAVAKELLRPHAPSWPASRTISEALRVVHFAYPVVLATFFLFGLVAHSILTIPKGSAFGDSTGPRGPNGKPLPPSAKALKRENNRANKKSFSPLQKTFFHWLSAGIIGTFAGTAGNVVVHALTEPPWWCGQAAAVYVISSIFVYALFLISLVDTQTAPTVVHVITWLVGFSLELFLFAGSLVLFRRSRVAQDHWDLTELTLDILRLVFLLALVGGYILFRGIQGRRSGRDAGETQEPDERTGLLRENHVASDVPNGHGPGDGHGANGDARVGYGSTDQAPKPEREEEAPPPWARPTKTPSKSWWEYLNGYSLFFPYLWPSKSRRLQVVVVVCFTIALLQRGVNILVPTQLGVITNILSGKHGVKPYIPWGEIFLFGFYKLLQGNNGALGAMRSSLWIPISQYSYQALSTSAFEHVHGLSLDFHLGKKTGEVLSALSKGSSINTFLEQVTFSILPMIVDLGVAIAYFLIAFDAYYALVIAIVAFWYVYITVRIAQWRADIRRKMVNADRDQDAVKNDSMVSYETVKYFNAEEYEFQRYRDAIETYQEAEYKAISSLNLLNVTQNGVFLLGLLITSFIAAYQVTTGQRDVGQFVTLLTYMSQLQQPLNYFGSLYRSIQSAMINSERMLELFKEKPSVVDEANAKMLPYCQGNLEFRHVRFCYDERKPALDGLTFVAPAGTTTALVGESGGGKSTVFRLLFRFYNADSGQIVVDGHDVRDVTIESLRRHIGVVPQDTVLFNETLMYNLKYANPDATDEMVFEACRAASIHHRILSFPDGYLTKVGERGLRLSGGEKQRVAIARTILKDPRIILLDEATAALDSETEEHIQVALETLSEGRTMLVIAHRLSTVINADQILCLHEGRVAEAGTHHELLELNGRYANMWNKQIRAEKLMQESVQAGAPVGDGTAAAADEEAADDKAAPDVSGHATTDDSVDEGVFIDSEATTAIFAGNNAGGDLAGAGLTAGSSGENTSTAATDPPGTADESHQHDA